jgi:transcriptional regulator
MGARKNDILQGTLVLLVLETLASGGPMHGYAITSQINRISGQLLRVEEGSLYPALHRMQQAGWLRAEWRTTEKNREARFYSITSKGRNQLTVEQESWLRLTDGDARVMRAAAGLELK